jgi:hypothetical protein
LTYGAVVCEIASRLLAAELGARLIDEAIASVAHAVSPVYPRAIRHPMSFEGSQIVFGLRNSRGRDRANG